MTKKQAIKKSIAHWERMIDWAKKQNSKEQPFLSTMREAIDENWYGESCPLCNLTSSSCEKCPLAIKYGWCSCSGNKNKWFDVRVSRTWAEWLRNAKGLLKQLKSL